MALNNVVQKFSKTRDLPMFKDLIESLLEKRVETKCELNYETILMILMETPFRTKQLI